MGAGNACIPGERLRRPLAIHPDLASRSRNLNHLPFFHHKGRLEFISMTSNAQVHWACLSEKHSHAFQLPKYFFDKAERREDAAH